MDLKVDNVMITPGDKGCRPVLIDCFEGWFSEETGQHAVCKAALHHMPSTVGACIACSQVLQRHVRTGACPQSAGALPAEGMQRLGMHPPPHVCCPRGAAERCTAALQLQSCLPPPAEDMRRLGVPATFMCAAPEVLIFLSKFRAGSTLTERDLKPSDLSRADVWCLGVALAWMLYPLEGWMPFGHDCCGSVQQAQWRWVRTPAPPDRLPEHCRTAPSVAQSLTEWLPLGAGLCWPSLSAHCTPLPAAPCWDLP